MIVFNNILQKLSEHGWSTYRLVKEKKLGNGTITRIRNGQSITTDSLDIICDLCDCQPSDLISYVRIEQGK